MSLEDIRSKVQRLLTANFRVELREDGEWMVRNGSTAAIISLRSFTPLDDEELGHIRVRAPLLLRVKLTDELYRWVATDGHQYRFGTVCLYEDSSKPGYGTLGFEYSLLGADVDESELRNAVAIVAITADRLDTELQKKFGGEMFGEDD